jgi:hypothetical protein
VRSIYAYIEAANIRRDPDLHGAELSQQEKYIESLGKIDL